MNCENAKSIRQWLPSKAVRGDVTLVQSIQKPLHRSITILTAISNFPFTRGGFSMLRIHNCGVNEPSARKRKRRVGLEISLQWPTASQQSTQKDDFTVAFMKRIIESYCYGKFTLINADHF